jgi:hypothetical protein
MRRRIASPVPPFDVVPHYVVAAAKRAFMLRARSDRAYYVGSGSPLTIDLRRTFECRGG